MIDVIASEAWQSREKIVVWIASFLAMTRSDN